MCCHGCQTRDWGTWTQAATSRATYRNTNTDSRHINHDPRHSASSKRSHEEEEEGATAEPG